MKYIELHKSETVEVRFDTKTRRIEEIYHGFVEDDEIRLFKNKMSEAIKNFKLISLLSDMSEFKGASPEIQVWVRDEWLETIQHNGIENISMVIPKDIFADFSLKNALGSKVWQSVKSQKFDNFDAADMWCNNL